MCHLVLEIYPDQQPDFVVDKVSQGTGIVDQEVTLFRMVVHITLETGRAAVDHTSARFAHQAV